jgi:hypothetical protein
MRANGTRLRAWTGLLFFAVALAGCAGSSSKSQNAALACETAQCDCIARSGFFVQKKPLEWDLDGTAKCSTGYQLEIIPPPSQRWTVQ